MSQENVEIIKATMAAFNRGDRDAALSYVAPNVKYDTSWGSPAAWRRPDLLLAVRPDRLLSALYLKGLGNLLQV